MRLQTKYILLIIFIITLSAVLISMLSNKIFHYTLESEYKHKGEIITYVLKELISKSVINNDVLSTKEAIDKIVNENNEIEYIYIFGFDGRIFTYTFEGGFPRSLAKATNDSIENNGVTINKYLLRGVEIFEVSSLLIKGMKARVHIGLNESRIHMQAGKMDNHIIMLSFIVALVGILLSFYLSHRVSVPLKLLTNAIRDFGKGKNKTDVSLSSGSTEVVELMNSFNVMIEERKTLEKELRQREAELLQLNSELKDFTTIASHDLQEPLRKVVAFADRLQDKYSAVLDENGMDYLKRMQKAALRMSLLIEDLLKLSRVSTKSCSFEPVDLNKTINNVLNDLEMRISQSEAEITTGHLPVIEADRVQMHQLFQNILSNALKYRTSGRNPVITIESDMHDDRFCDIAIHDNGIGFEEHHFYRILKPFQRLHGHTEYEGNGMGLAICNKIIQRHGGSFTAKSEPGEGSTFFIKLRLKSN